jgi:hypothetical protein
MIGKNAYRDHFKQGATLFPDFGSLVIYTSSYKDASAVVVAPQDFDVQFVCDHKAYWFAANSQNEAHYVAAFLNSRFANNLIKEFQSKGLMGARDVHKTILMLRSIVSTQRTRFIKSSLSSIKLISCSVNSRRAPAQGPQIRS